MKIKAILVASALLLCGAAYAQETNVDANGKLQYGPYETNKFWDNWFIDAGVGVNVSVANIRGILKQGMSVGYYGAGLNVNVAVGKWFTPCWGARIGWDGINAADIMTHSFASHKFSYLHFDALCNVSHLFAGYKQLRAVNVVPYLSFGYMFTQSFAGGIGCMLQIRLSDVVSLVPDFRAIACRGSVFGVPATGSWSPRAWNFSGTIGVQVNLGKNSWTRKSTTAAIAAAALAASTAANSELQAKNSALAAAAAAAAAKQAQLTKENGDLKDELARAAAAKKTIDLAETPVYAYFQIGKATLSSQEIAHLEYNVKTAIAENNNVVLTITGNADSKTGSKRRNAKLAQQRADYLYKLLTEKFGLDAKNFTVKSNGGNDVFPCPALNRHAVVSK